MLSVPRNAGHAQRYVTTNAQRATIQLSDGSSVELGSASELTVLPSFNQNNRTVLVRGAAYFQVADRSTLPFVVRSDNAVARVLGTEFAVRKYPEDTSVTIVVASGKVSVGTAGPQTPSNATTSVVLTKGDNAAVDAQGTVQISHTTNIARALAWTHGMLVFENTPFRTVIPEVERLYDLKIQVTDSSILDRHVTTQLTSESVSEAVHLLASIMNVSVTQHGQQVKFFESPSRR
jgi:ferric-dicitrate binding protein FerR (iron transport regulator)